MTPVPPPASPCVRVALAYTQADGSLAGSRFFLSYSGAAPSAANCATLASDVAAAWATHVAPAVTSEWSLTAVDVLDIATDSGAFGIAAVSTDGSQDGTALPAQVAVNCEFDIGRRYRGGKPRMFWPTPSTGQVQDASHWTDDFVTAFNAVVVAFFAEVTALSVGSMGSLAHVNLSYYKGFTNVTNSSGRTRAAPTYRAAALLDSVTGYATKAEMGSQKRRRIATTQ
jgi:hypothetical protein